MPDLAEPDREQFVGPKGGINAESEQTEIAGSVAQNTLDVVDRDFGADRFDFDTGAGFWPVRILAFDKRHTGHSNMINF